MLTQENFDQNIIEKKACALITFTADWCRPCLLQKPIIKNLATRYAEKALVEIIDVDIEAALADRFEARTLPTTVLFCQGEIVEALAGFQSEEFLSSYLDLILAEAAKAPEEN